MSITALYAGIVGLLLVVLSTRVIVARRSQRISLGSGGNDTLERRIRAHGNLAEYGPLGLILIGLLELGGWPAGVLHILGILLIAGRLLHGWAFSFTAGNTFGRTGGMALTLTAIGFASLLNLASFVLHGLVPQ